MFHADIAALPDLQAQDTLNSAAFHDTVAAWDKEFGYFVDSINGTLRYVGTGNDSLSGSENRDTIIGLQGDDVITGQFGEGLTADSFDYVGKGLNEGGDLILRIKDTGEILTIKNWFADGQYQLDKFQFADGIANY